MNRRQILQALGLTPGLLVFGFGAMDADGEVWRYQRETNSVEGIVYLYGRVSYDVPHLLRATREQVRTALTAETQGMIRDFERAVFDQRSWQLHQPTPGDYLDVASREPDKRFYRMMTVRNTRGPHGD